MTLKPQGSLHVRVEFLGKHKMVIKEELAKIFTESQIRMLRDIMMFSADCGFAQELETDEERSDYETIAQELLINEE